jgi:AraC-like DNA-binding protein
MTATMGTPMGDAPRAAPSDPWFRTRSPKEAVHVCAAPFYPHRLALLGPSHSFGMSQRVTRAGPITIGEFTYDTDVRIDFDEPRASYHVCVPLNGRVESRYRGQLLTSTPALAAIYRPDARVNVTRFPGGSRHLQVKIDQLEVDRALETLCHAALDLPIDFDAALPVQAGAAHSQLQWPDSMMRHALVLEPLVESLIHGFLVVTDHPYRQALAAPPERGRPAAVRDAMDIIEARPHLPLTTATLATQCHVSVRTLQAGFQRHLAMSPMDYLRLVRLRRAHRDLRSPHPAHSTVAAIAHRWGFTHLGRFAAAHKKMYGVTPLQTLRATR